MVAPAIVAAGIIAGGAIGGGLLANRANRNIADQQADLQREFAQHGIRWKVEDAKAAGLHPLYALGAQGATYSPTYYSDSLGPAVASASQQIGSMYHGEAVRKDQARRADSAALQQKTARIMGQNIEMDRLILDQQRAQAQMAADFAQANYYNSMAASVRETPNVTQDLVTDQAGVAAAQDSGLVKVSPSEVKTNLPGSPSIEAGSPSLWVVEKAGMGLSTVRMNDEAAEAWGDVAAPVINAAATTFYYFTDTLPKLTKQNVHALLVWWNTRGRYNEFGEAAERVFDMPYVDHTTPLKWGPYGN